MDNENIAPEVKADLNAEFRTFMGGFETFRETNDRRLAEIERKGADCLTVDKLARVEAALDANQRRMDELVLKSARPSLGGAAPARASEGKAAFDRFVRSGDDGELRRVEQKSLLADGSLTAPVEIETEVMRRLTAMSPIRQIATVRQISSGSYKKAVANGVVGAWAAETGARSVDSSTLKALNFPTMELYAMPAASSVLVEDAAVDLDMWLADEIETVFAEQETKAFVDGDGVTQPKGVVRYAGTGPNGDLSTERLGIVKTGVNGGFAANPSDILIDLVYAVKSNYRQNANFVMSRQTQAVIRKFKDVDGNYIWSPPSVPGGRAGILNFTVVEAEDMPAIGNGSLSVAFGDFRRGYLIVDRQGLKILRDPYSAKPNILFYTTKRVGGGVQDFDAIKLLKFSL